jgi:signal transduction histidine kinase
VYWLRRIPTETRIVVFVVFLALLQAILLSLFGLSAIEGERRTAAEEAEEGAVEFLRDHVEAPAWNAVQLEAEAAFAAAFAQGGALPADGLALAAYGVDPDGSIRSSDGVPLLLTNAALAREEAAARARAEEIRDAYRRSEIDEAEKRRRDLEFALRHPFARDEEGHPLALLFGWSALHGEAAPDAATLLRLRRVALLNRLQEAAPEDFVERFLLALDGAGRGVEGYEAGKAAQEEELATLRALRAEAARFERGLRFALRGGPAPAPLFCVRSAPSAAGFRVLLLHRDRLDAILARVAEGARRAAEARGLTVAIEPSGPAAPGGPARSLRGLEGYRAVARVDRAFQTAGSGGRERLYWYIIGFSILGILAGGFLTARVVMREVKLAKLKSGFVSNVTHELKTPLTSIRMFVDMLRSGQVKEPAEREECLGVIAQETERLGRLIQRVLDFSRLDARMRRFRWIVGPIAPVVEREAERFRRVTGLPDDRFVVRIAPSLPPVHYDPEAFGEVLSNLLSNAYKFSPKDDRRIALTVGVGRGRVLIAVEDNGPGVPPTERQKIFEPFYRADDFVTRSAEGSGLGLSIARSIVRAHGGAIGVDAREGGGARFVVALPAVSASARGAAAPAAEAAR